MIVQFHRDVVECQYSAILTGFSPFLVHGKSLLVKHPTPKELLLANAAALSLMDRYKSEGLLSEYDILKDLAKKGIWTQADENDLISIEKRIESKRKVVSQLALPSQVKQVEGEIRLLCEDVKKKKDKKTSFLVNSYEFRVQQDKMEYLTFLTIYKTLEERYWADFSDFEDEDKDFVFELADRSNRAMNEITTPLLRYIARTTDARHRLKVSPLDKQASMYLIELHQWCDFYERIIAMPEPPNEDILLDDDKLDGWLISRRSNKTQSVNTSSGFVSHPGATKQDMEILGAASRSDVIKLANKDK